ncbi:MAG: glycosyltransferase family 2 protein [bacterium]|nr:glycosyltransferase family 2 protein [bacterium]
MKTLTVICPAYNEEEGIAGFYHALNKEVSKLFAYHTSVLFVDDGSTDNTYPALQSLAASHKDVQVIRFSRNFGHQMALLAGIDHAAGDVIVMMDSDLQHPPAVIKELLAEYEKGNDIVYTVRDDTQTVGLLRRIIGKLFYWALNTMSEVHISENASDFRLVSGRAAQVIRTGIHERNMFLRGIIRWIGFRQSYVHFTTGVRMAGASKYSIGRLLQLATSGIISFSKKPLRAASFTGVLFAFFGFCVALVTSVQYFTDDALPSGWATLVILMSVFGGIQLIFLGIIGEYVGAIFDEVKGRPRYIVEEAINIKAEL